MSQGSKILIYIVSFFFQVVGIVLGIIWMNDKQDEEKRQVGKTALFVSLGSFALSCICYVIYFFFIIAASGSSY